MEIIKYNDIKLYVPIRYYHNNLKERFIKGTYEKEEIYLSKKYFNINDNVLELGSCLGYIASVLSKICNNIISIEANPELKVSLDNTKNANNLQNVTFINGYLDIEKKYIDFQSYDNIVAGSGDREDLNINNTRGWGDTLKLYKISTILMNEIDNIDTINSLVIDIEGGELTFLKNFKTFIENNIKKICIELHGHLMKDGRNFDIQCLQLIKQMGFKQIENIGISYYFEK